MPPSANLSLLSTAVPAPMRGSLRQHAAAAWTRAATAFDAIVPARHSRRRRALSQGLPWDVGLDRLAEQANPPWIPRGW